MIEAFIGYVRGYSRPRYRLNVEASPIVELAAGAEGSARVFARLDPATASAEAVLARIREAGLVAGSRPPRPLLDLLEGGGVATVVVLCADREPVQSALIQSFRERSEDACLAALLLARAAGAAQAVVAVPASLSDEAAKVAGRRKVAALSIPARYPESLEPLVALRAGGGPGVRVISVETALAALDAVREGRPQTRKVFTAIGPDRKSWGNYRVGLGTRIGDALQAVGLRPEDGDRVIAGGPMTGVAQTSLAGPIDEGVDALTLVRAEELVADRDEPCVNCGACLDVCPVNLQVPLLGRWAELGRFDRTEALSVSACVECGLCAAVCTARRPLVQWLRRAKREESKKEKGKR